MIYLKIVGLAGLLFFDVVAFFWTVGKMIKDPNIIYVVGFILFTFLVNYLFYLVSQIGSKQKAKQRKQGRQQEVERSINNEK